MNPSQQSRPTYFLLPVQISARAWSELELSTASLAPPPGLPLYPLRQLADVLGRRGYPASSARLNLLGVLSRVFGVITERYLERHRCRLTANQITVGNRPLELPALEAALGGFARLFPPAAILEGEPPARYLKGPHAKRHRRLALVELFILATQTRNRAADDFLHLFDDRDLERHHGYRTSLEALDRRLQDEPATGLFGQSLLELLAAPLQAAPDSLDGQLRYIETHWEEILPPELLQDLRGSFDLLEEEQRHRGFGPGPLPTPAFGADSLGPEAFSADTDWMPNLVLIAKAALVWLAQLSERYRRPITRLDEIPDAELDALAEAGFNGLWLIGIWERSAPSLRIKQIRGNAEAAASAYALFDYTIAQDLGGEAALERLTERCARRGIRLTGDVVPNHTGLHSRWLVEHPDWFINLPHPPYPGYRFSGPDLSPQPEISLRLEDGYYDHSDAAVVFEHRDHRSGQVRYVYHGNDGTHMPWNDTAQLNYLLPEMREAMIRTILAVARRFPVIRFDAAMTLAKKHFQRLWYPRPGGGAGVPSRTEHAMSQEAFDRAFPVEFWRELVDRVAAEAPGTLLIAEAFWLLEGYFVRTLGMHRVYNSAFMNMLKLEENAKYRTVIKDVLEFNPGILQRFVNFMNNPDEATAVEQFGKGDKYFGVAVLLATLPGLPLFGHGQVEGLKEKYGMEYRRPSWDEPVDEAFLHHHRQLVFPLLRMRPLFSSAENFQLFDFYSGGHVNEDVFAYSNGRDGQRALVVYHNRHAETGGWLRTSAAKARYESSDPARLETVPLAKALGLQGEQGLFCRFRDLNGGLEYLRPCDKLRAEGFHLQLGPYRCHVFIDFVQLADDDGLWGELYRRIGDRPVTDLDLEMRRLRYAPLLGAWRAVLDPQLLEGSAEGELRQRAGHFLAAASPFLPWPLEAEGLGGRLEAALDDLSRLTEAPQAAAALELLRPSCAGTAADQPPPLLLAFALLQLLRGGKAGTPGQLAAWYGEIPFDEGVTGQLPAPGAGEPGELLGLLLAHAPLWGPGRPRGHLNALFDEDGVRRYLDVHQHEDTWYFHKERFESLLAGLFSAGALLAAAYHRDEPDAYRRHLEATATELQQALVAAGQGGYRVETLLGAAPQGQAPLPVPPQKPVRPSKLKILLVSSEVAPFAKSGGLADVAGSLPVALRRLGHDVRVILPFYRSTAGQGLQLERAVARADIAIAGIPQRAVLHEGVSEGVPVYFVDHPGYFDREWLYGTAAGDYPDNAERFGFFCRAVLELLPEIGFCPDLCHLNDWQTGLIPVLLRTEYGRSPFHADIATLTTIHNLGYRGLFPPQVLKDLGLSPGLCTVEGLEFFGQISFLKGGLVFSDRINTVSESYCREVQTPEMGVGFDGILRHRNRAFSGILNGLDPRSWDPADDPALGTPFHAGNLRGKAACKRALLRELGLPVSPGTPLIAMVTRLDTQKGLDIVEDAWQGLMKRPLQIAILGTGEAQHMERLKRLQRSHPQQVSLTLDFDEALARRIYAGSDLFLMPSHYEPCGLGQLIALRYGSVPLVRATGGLADTICDPQQDEAAANGFAFGPPRSDALLATLDRALERFADRRAWLKMVRCGMGQDFSWASSAQRYLELYRDAMEERNGR